ncbi:MAG: TonB-dependent receptor [Azoarcus sp.]|nr:TonB-dependent receptor [Azoarcus sp.]
MSCFPFHTRPLAAFVLSLSAASALAAQVVVNIPAQPLAASIVQLADATGLSIAVDASLVAGKTAPAVKGEMEATTALRQLLAGSGLSVTFEGNRAVITEARGEQGATELAPVVVTGVAEEGSAEVGYKPETTKQLGPWGDKKILDTPYSRSVMSEELIQNTVASDVDQLMKMNPVVQVTVPTRVLDGANQVNIRGFGNVISLDGMPTYSVSNSSLVPLEDIERVEVHSGPSTFLFDANAVGGVINYRSKKPTSYRLANLTVGNYGGDQYFAHIDLGGPLNADKTLRYRLNLLDSEGQTAIRGNKLTRQLYSGALEWNPTENLLIGLHARRHRYKQNGSPPYWNSVSTGYDDVAPDSHKTYTQSYVGSDTYIDTYDANVKWDINDTFTLRAEYVENNVEGRKDETYAQRTYINPSDLGIFLLYGAAPKYVNKGGNIYLDTKFDTGPVKHKLVVGYAITDYKSYPYQTNTPTWWSSPSGMYTFSNYDVPKPTLTQPWIIGNRYNNLHGIRMGVKVGDEIRFNDQWSLLVGASRSRLVQNSYNVSGSKTSGYDEAKVTPTVSLLYKPKPWLTVYGSYIEQYELGTIVSSYYINANEVFDPYVSKQGEFGVKAELKDLLLTAALFRINKMNSFDDEIAPGMVKLTRDGRQIHEGLELTAVGKVDRHLTVFGGFTWLHPYVDKTSNPAIKDKRPTGVAGNMFKLYAEYAIPGVPGLYLTGGGYHTGHQYQNNTNTVKLPSYTVYDLGGRYETKMLGNEMIFRLNIANVTDRAYWVSSYAVGEPRSIGFSVTTKF